MRAHAACQEGFWWRNEIQRVTAAKKGAPSIRQAAGINCFCCTPCSILEVWFATHRWGVSENSHHQPLSKWHLPTGMFQPAVPSCYRGSHVSNMTRTRTSPWPPRTALLEGFHYPQTPLAQGVYEIYSTTKPQSHISLMQRVDACHWQPL